MDTKIRAFLVLVLSVLTFNAYAFCSTCADTIYVGNQNRVRTVWQPAHCGSNGCWKEGYYIKFLCNPTCRDVVWVDGRYDRNGNWIPAHFKVLRYKVVNPGSEQYYPGFPI